MFAEFRAAVEELDDAEIDPKEFSAFCDAMEVKRCRVVAAATRRGDHLLSGQSPVSWVARTCQMSKTSASDRLCVGAQLDSLPQVEQAVKSGQIGYQATSVICHLSEQLGEKRDRISEDDWIGFAQRFPIKELRYLAREARQVWDPEGAEDQAEEDFEKRELFISETAGRMYRIDGWLDPVGGAAFKTAIEALSKPLGSDDRRSGPQRRADAAVDMAHHAMDQGTLPRRNGAKPHIAVQATVESLKGAPGAVAHLENGMPVSNKTVERLACDGTLHRVLKAGSVVVDVGRATRAVHPAQWRALKARHRTCAWTECDRPISWTNPHHIEFWSRGGKTNLSNLVPLCYFHHRLVHEGGWQVIRAGDAVTFLPPDRILHAA